MNLFRAPETPSPATFSEGIRRANTALPPQVRIAFRPVRYRGRPQPQPYRILLNGQDAGGAASLTAAVFAALQAHRKRYG